jgi:hypothetical protein
MSLIRSRNNKWRALGDDFRTLAIDSASKVAPIWFHQVSLQEPRGALQRRKFPQPLIS